MTDLDGPVFALVNLPETVKGALFARYSRYPGTLRRLFLEEFADSLPEGGSVGRRARASAPPQLYERIFVGYGDDSVAQLGGAHVACEWVSNVLTKVLQRPRLARLPRAVHALHRLRRADAGRRLPLLPRPRARAGVRGGDGRAVRHLRGRAAARARVGRRDVPARGRRAARPRARRAVNAKALDLLRGLLPAASLSHMGIYATGQAYEQLILHLIGHPLPEARRYGELILAAIKAVMPSFVVARRAARPRRRAGSATWPSGAPPASAGRRGSGSRTPTPTTRARRSTLTHVDGDEEQLLAALLFEAAGASEERIRATVAALVGRRARRAAGRPGRRARRTAATAPAAGSRRCATASRSSPTTARSATSSATAC